MLEYLGAGEEREGVVHVVRAALQCHPAGDPIWRDRYLPLLILASEAGYEYRGPGRDYWETVERLAERSFSYNDRTAMSGWFRLAAERYGAARPPDSDWSRTFRHIAWPITHAVLPLDLQRALTSTLSELPLSIGPETSREELQAALERASRDKFGVRFGHWLGDLDLVSGVVPALLERAESWIDAALISRIRTDIERSEFAANELEVAKARQGRLAHERVTRGAKQTHTVPDQWGTLSLSIQGDEPTLMACLPPAAAELLPVMRQALEGRCLALSLWGLAAPIRVERLFSGYPVPLQLPRLPETDARPLVGLDDLALPPRAKAVLDAVRFMLEPPLLFEAGLDDNEQVLGPGTVGGGYLVVGAMLPDELPHGVVNRGEVAGLSVCEVSTSEPAARVWVRNEGVDLRGAATLRWVGLPSRAPAGEPVLVQPDPLIAHVRLTKGVRGTLSVDREEVDVVDGDILSLSAAQRTVLATLTAEGCHATARAKTAPGAPAVPLCSAELVGERSVQALLRRSLSLRLSAVCPLEHLTLRLSVHAEGRELSWSEAAIFNFPTVFGPDDDIWKHLLKRASRPRLRRASSLSLTASIGRLWFGDWRLEERPVPYLWTQDEGRVTLTSEGASLPIQATSSARLFETTLHTEFTATPATVTLLAPQDGDRRLAICRCVGPDHVTLDWDRGPRPRLCRKVSDDGDAIGLEHVLSAYLSWSLAETDELIGVDLRRRQVAREFESWAVEVVCGERWAAAEQTARHGDLWTTLVERCLESRISEEPLGFDDYISLEDGEPEQLARFFERRLRRSLPDLDALVRTPATLEESAFVATINGAFNDAYGDFKAHLEQANSPQAGARDLAADGWTDGPRWRDVLLTARRAAELFSVLELIWPADGQRELTELEYARASAEQLSKHLAAWGRRHRAALQGPNWTADEVHTVLSVWVDPALASRRPWEEALPRLLVDRGLARAIRYAALRFLASLGGNSALGETSE